MDFKNVYAQVQLAGAYKPYFIAICSVIIIWIISGETTIFKADILLKLNELDFIDKLGWYLFGGSAITNIGLIIFNKYNSKKLTTDNQNLQLQNEHLTQINKLLKNPKKKR